MRELHVKSNLFRAFVAASIRYEIQDGRSAMRRGGRFTEVTNMVSERLALRQPS